jgi:hypothetical protein
VARGAYSGPRFGTKNRLKSVQFLGVTSSFATSFYRALGYGRDLETAFKLGCTQINLESLREQDRPKLLANKVNPSDIVLVDHD